VPSASPPDLPPSLPSGSDLLPLLTDPSLSTHLLCQILGFSPTQLADLLESEEVQQTLAAADRIDAIRAPRIARATLTEITADERANPETRRKAASTLARMTGQEKPPTRRKAASPLAKLTTPLPHPKQSQPSTPGRRINLPSNSLAEASDTNSPSSPGPEHSGKPLATTHSGGILEMQQGDTTMKTAATLTLAAISTAAHAGLVSISGGGIIHENPDPNFPLPNNVQANVVQGINEVQNLILGDDLSIDDLADLIGVVNLPAGSRVSSHLLAFDPAGTRSVSDIEIAFDANVLAVITADRTLFDTHALFGLEGLNYPGFTNLYGFEAGSENFSVDGNRVFFSGTASSPGDYFRVLTAVPTPATATLFGLACLTNRRRRRR
jgi:DNA-binding transcriptional regulator YdaS (Cro superfamily)